MFIDWKDWCWSWSSNTLMWKAVKSCEELTHWKRPWCWERLRAGGEGDDRGWDGSMASSTPWTWVWVNSGSWWWTGRPGALRFVRSQTVGYDWATELNWTEEELKSLLIRVKEESERTGLKLNIQETKIKASSPITSWQNRWWESGSSGRFYVLGLQNHCRLWLQSQN